MYLVDLDDFCEENTDWNLILVLKELIPNLKLNLFTIPGKCSRAFVEEMYELDWIDLIPHGNYHFTSREMEHWDYLQSHDYLENLEQWGWVHGFKAPGWQVSDGMYDALLERDWWIADQEYNNYRRPVALRVYLLDSPNKIHGHIGHWGAHNDNSLEYIFDQIASLESEFGFMFIDDLMARK